MAMFAEKYKRIELDLPPPSNGNTDSAIVALNGFFGDADIADYED